MHGFWELLNLQGTQILQILQIYKVKDAIDLTVTSR